MIRCKMPALVQDMHVFYVTYIMNFLKLHTFIVFLNLPPNLCFSFPAIQSTYVTDVRTSQAKATLTLRKSKEKCRIWTWCV
jgi:hypothetical protein